MRPEPPPPRSPRFYVDEDVLGLGKALMWLRDDVIICGSTTSPYREMLTRGLDDVDWIPIVAKLGLVAITNNKQIRLNPLEARVALECKARIVCLSGKTAQKSTWDRAYLLMRHWESLEKKLAELPYGPWWITVTQGGTEVQRYFGQS